MASLKFKINLILFFFIALWNVQALSQTVGFVHYIWDKDGRVELIEGRIDRLENGKVNITPFLTRIGQALEQSHRENTHRINELSKFLSDGGGRTLSFACERYSQDGRACREDLESTIEVYKTRFLERQSQRLLYPDWYVPRDGHKSDDIDDFLMNLRQIAERRNNLLCTKREQIKHLCGDDFNMNTNTLLYSSSSQYQQILRTLRNSGSGFTQACLIGALNNTLSTNRQLFADPFSRMPETCQGLSGTDQEVCEGMKRDFSLLQERVHNIMTNIKPNEDIDPLTYSNRSDLNSGISDFLNRLGQNVTCPDYALGEKRIPDNGQKYSVKRERDGSYTVTIPIVFSAGEDYDGPVPKDQVHTHYLERTRRQTNELSPYLLGPNGEQINIVIADGRSSDPCLVPNEITIEDRSHTPNSITYPSNIEPIFTLHEIHHTLGLYDEYPSVIYGYSVDANGRRISHVRGGYHCHVTQTNSLMNNEPGERLRNVRNGHNSSLLDPTHFNVILYGECQTRPDVRLYHQCSSLAYATEFNNNLNCPPLKDRCDASDMLGRGPVDPKRGIREVADQNESIIRELQNANDCSQVQGRVRAVKLDSSGFLSSRDYTTYILPLEVTNVRPRIYGSEEKHRITYDLRYIHLDELNNSVQNMVIEQTLEHIPLYLYRSQDQESGGAYMRNVVLNPEDRPISNCWLKRTVPNITFQTDQNSSAAPSRVPETQGPGTR